MAGKGSKPGERRGGRTKGTPNKRTAAMRELCEMAAPGFHPIAWMTAIAAGTATKTVEDENGEMKEVPLDATLDQRIQCANAVAPYFEPKKKSIEHSFGDGPRLVPAVMVVPKGRTPDEWKSDMAQPAQDGSKQLQ